MKSTALVLSLVFGSVILFFENGNASLDWRHVTEVPAATISRLHVHNDTLYASNGALIFRYGLQENRWDTLTTPDPEITYIDAIIKTGSRLLAGSFNKGVFESDDDGLSWTPRNAGLTGLGSSSIIDFTTRGDSLYVGTDGAGIFVLNLNASANWTEYQNGMPWNIAGTILSLHNFDNCLLAGAGLNSTMFRNPAGADGWSEYPFSEFDPRGSGMIDLTSLGGIVYGAANNGLYVSHDSGVTWTADQVTSRYIVSGSVAADQDRVYSSLFFGRYGAYFYSSTGNGWQVLDSVAGALTYDLVVLGGRLYSAREDGLWYAELSPTGVDDGGLPLPDQFQLAQNYPNPFNPTTTIQFHISRQATVNLEIFNILGQRVRTLVDDTRSAGEYMVSWDGTDNGGNNCPSGIYLYRLQTGGQAGYRKMLLLK